MQRTDEIEAKDANLGESKLTQRAGSLSLRAKVEVAITALAIGISAVVFLFVTPSHVTNSTRISHLESIVKCPTCISVSTADANTASAIALRSYISTMVNSGASDQEVIAQLEATYGKSVLLVPPNGFGSLLVAGTIAIALVVPFGFVLVNVRRKRRQRRGVDTSPMADENLIEGFDELDSDSGQRGVALDEDGYDTTTSGLEVIEQDRRPGRFGLANLSRAQRILGALGLLFLISGASILGISLFTSNGSVSSTTLSPNQISTLISNGQTLASFGQDKSALSAFSRVLRANPNQPVALAWNGWLLTKSGVSANSKSLVDAGVVQIRQSISVDSSYLYSHLFYGLVLNNDLNEPSAAVAEFAKFFALNPPQNLVSTIKSELVAIYEGAKVALPPQLA